MNSVNKDPETVLARWEGSEVKYLHKMWTSKERRGEALRLNLSPLIPDGASDGM